MMRNPLHKTLKKEFKQNIARYLSIMIILVVMISAVSGFLTVAYGYKDALKENQISSHVEDGQFIVTNKMNQKTIDEIQKKSLQIYENFYSEQDIKEDTTLRLFKNRDYVNQATLHTGRLPENDQEIALDRLFALKNNYEVGTTIRIDHYSVTIVGLISVPDYSALIEKSNDLMMDPIHFGIGIVDDKSFDYYSESNINYQYSYINTTLLYIMVVILAFIFVVISQTIIEEQAPVIGTLLSNGYTKREIVHHYMMLPMLISLTASLIGNIIGYTLFPPVFSNMYNNSYCLPPLTIHFMLEAFLSTTVIPFVFMMVVLYIMLNYKLRISPLRLLRRDLRQHKKRKYIYLKNKSFIKRFQKRIIIQNKGTYVMLFFGIFFASFIFIFGFMMTPSIDHYLENVERSIHADYQYILKAPIEIKDAEKATVTTLETNYHQADLDLDVTFYGISEKSQYYQLDLPSQKNHIIMSYDLGHKLNLQEGDSVRFTNPYTEKNYDLIVDRINEDKGVLAAFMSQELCNELLSEDHNYFNAYLSNRKLNINEQYILSTITKDDMTKIGEQMTTTFAQLIPIMTSVSLVIYFVVIYILTKLVLDRNTLYMSFLKVMGYENKEIKKIYLQATTPIVVISLFISLPLCIIGLNQLLLFAFMQFAGYMEAYIPYYLYGMVFIVGLTTYYIVNFVLTKQIQRIDLGESLKDME